MLYDSGVPENLWGAAAETAAYLINRSPTKNEKVTPAEKWSGRKPDLSNIVIFGSVAYPKVIGHLSKLQHRSSKRIFVGYTLNGSRIYDPNQNKIIRSSDVQFVEPIKKIHEVNNNGDKILLSIEDEDPEEDEEEEYKEDV